MPPPSVLLAVHVLLAPPALDLSAGSIDPAATTRGLRARVPSLDDWRIHVRDGAVAGQVVVELRGPDGRTQRRRVALTGATAEDRSRELAASLALLIQQWDDPPRTSHSPAAPASSPAARPRPASKPPAPPPPGPPPAIRGWLGLGPRLELGPGLVEGGLDLQGGAWLLREHLQPLASLGWSATGRDGLGLHTLRFGAGAAAGAPLADGRLWLGGLVLAHGAWTRVHDSRTVGVWSSNTEIGGLLQIRWPRWLIGVRTGVDLVAPELRARGNQARLERGPAQWFLGLSFGLVFG